MNENSKGGFKILAPSRRLHGEAMADLMAKSFSHFGGYYTWLNWVKKGYLTGSQYDWETSRIGLLDSRVVSHWGVWDNVIRIEEARLRMAGIGAVSTDGSMRKRGYLTETAETSLDSARASGYDLSVLFGIPDFYHRFGYCKAYLDETWTLPVDNLNRFVEEKKFDSEFLVRKVSLRSGKEHDVLYNDENRLFTGTVVRPSFPKWNPMYIDKVTGWRCIDGKGNLKAYCHVYPDGDTLVLKDRAGAPRYLMPLLQKLARKYQTRKIRCLTLHYLSPAGGAFRDAGARWEKTYGKTGGAMIRIINLVSCLQKMSPVLERRLQQMPAIRWTGNMLFVSDSENAAVRIDEGKVSGVSRIETMDVQHYKYQVDGGAALGRLIIGADEPGELVRTHGMTVRGEIMGILERLFPNQYPTMSSWDFF